MEKKFKTTFIKNHCESITDLKRGDIIYIKKVINGYYENWEAKFKKFEKGIIIAKAIRWNWNGNKWLKASSKLGIITARPSKCFIWGKDKKNGREYCHWLN